MQYISHARVRARVSIRDIYKAPLLGLFLFLAGLTVWLANSSAQAASSTYLNFQARVLSSAGAVIADGDYNIEYKLYNASSSSGSSQGSCSGDANCLWVETRTGANKVRVVNGYLSVTLGSVSAFASTINWDQQHWLTMNIGGTGSPSWDGEMSPRILLTAVPYSFSAGEVATTSGANRGKLSFSSVTNNPVIVLPDESGTVCTTGSVCSGYQSAGSYVLLAGGVQNDGSTTNPSIFINKTGSTANILQLQKSTADVFVIDNSGVSTFYTDTNLTYAGTENLAVTSDLASSVDVISVVATPSGTAGTTRGLFVQQANHGSNTNGLDNGIVIDNADADLAITNGLSFTNTGGGSYTQEISLMNGLTIANTDNNDLNLTENSVSLNIDFGETTGSTITFSTASKLELESTNDAADGLKLEATAGGIDIFASAASAGEDIDIVATGSSVNITSTEGVSDAITLNANGSGGDIDINANDAITIDSASVTLTLASGTTDFTIAGLDADSNVILSGMGTDANAVLYTTTGGVLTRVVETETGSQCLLSGAGSSGVPTWGSCPGGGGNTFLTMDTEDGSDPAADTSTDTLILTSTGANLTITGDSSADSITFDLVESTLAGLGLVANGDALDIVSGNSAIDVNADDITFDQNFSFAWTADHTWTLAGAENLDASYSSPPTDDFLKLSNSGQATTTDNVDGLEITLAQGAGSAINNAGLRIVASTTDGDSTLNGINIDLTNSSSGGTQRGLIVVNNDTVANASTEAMIALRNEEATASTVTDGLVISGTAGSGTDTIVDAIDVSDDNITNGINLGTNFLVASGDSINDFTGNAALVLSGNSLILDATVSGDGLSSTTSSGSGLEVIAGQGLSLLAGCGDTEILKWNETSDIWACSTDSGGGNSFTTIDTPSGTDPVADTSTDTLQLLVTGTNLTITGADNPESATFNIVESALAGAGLIDNSDALDIGAGNGITVNANDVAVNQNFAFSWTTDHDYTFTDTENLDIQNNTGAGGTANGLTVTMTPSSAAGTISGISITQASSSNTNPVDYGIIIDNLDADLAIANGIQIDNAGGGGYTNFINTSSGTFLVDGSGNLTAANITCNSSSCISTGEITDATITGDDIASSIAGAGLVLTAGSPDVLDIVSGNAGIVVNSNDITLDATVSGDGLSSTTSSGSGLEVIAGQGLTLLAGCADTEVLKWNEGSDIWACGSSGGGGNSFTTIDTPSGTDPVADTSSDTLQLLVTGTNLTITGADSPETITFDIDESVLAGAGLVANSSALDIVSGNAGIVVNAGDITLDATVSGDGLSSTTSSGSGLEIVAGQGLTLLAGCSDTQILKWNEGSDIWACSADNDSGGSPRLDIISAATGAGTAQDSNANSIFWNWDFQGAGVDSGLTISESSNSTSGSQDQQALLELITLSNSTASPLQVTAGGTDVGDIFFDLTGTSDFQVRDSGTSVFSVNDDGTIVAQNATNSTAAFTIATSTGTALFASDTSNLINRPGLAPSYTTTAQSDTEISDSDSVGQYTSIAIGVDGLPIISYYEGDTGGGGCGANECNLVVTHCGNAACTSGNTTTNFEDSDDVGQHTSIAVGSDGLAIISSYNVTGANLQVNKCANINCTSFSSETEVSDADDVGKYSSIVMNADGLPIIASYNDTGDNIQVARCAQAACTSLTSDTEISDADIVGQFTSVAIGKDNLPIISYYEGDTGGGGCSTSECNLRVTHCGDAGCTASNTTTELEDADIVGQYTSIAITTDGLPIISHQNITNGNLQFSKCANTNCSSLSSDTEISDADAVGRSSSIAIGTDGLPIISHQHNTSFNLQISKCANSACTSLTSESEISDADNVGDFSSIAVSTDGLPIITSFNDTNDNLQVFKCANRNCTSTATSALTSGIDLGTLAAPFRSVYFNTLNMGDEEAGLSFDDQGTLKVRGNIMAGQGIEYMASDTNPSCATGEYKIYADLSEAKLKKCQNGSTSDLSLSGRTLSTQFGDYFTGGAYESKNSYFGEEFNIGKANNQTCTGSTTATEWGWARGDMGSHTAASGTCGTSSNRDSGELNFSIKLGNTAGTCTAASQLDTVNGIERITATSTTAASNSANCVETLAATQSTSNKIYLTNNRPVVTMKVKPSTLQDSGSGGNGVVHIGMSAGNTAGGVALNSLDNSVYFTNCSTWNDGAVPSGCSNTTWYGVTSDGDSSNVLTCSTGSGSLTSQFSYLRIEVISNAEIHFYADYDVSNGISESECGAGATTTANMPAGSTAMAPWMQSVFKSNTANSTILDLDYFRSWQDDSVPMPEEAVETTPSGEDIVTEAPIEPDTESTSSIADTDPSQNKDFFSFLASTSEDQIFYHDVYIKGTLFANKIKANQIEGLEIYTDKLDSLLKLLALQSTTQVNGASTDPDQTGQETTTSSGSGDGTGNDALQMLALSLDLNDGLTVGGQADFHGNAFFYKLVTFVERTVFRHDVTLQAHLLTEGQTPTVTIEAASGTASPDTPAPTATVDGNDISGQITLRVGDGTEVGELVEVKFNRHYQKKPQIILTPLNANSVKPYFFAESTVDGFKLKTTQPTTSGSDLIFNYLVIE